MATLMSDEVFHEVAYRAKKRDHLIAGIDEFLDAVTVLPPGEWGEVSHGFDLKSSNLTIKLNF